MKELGGDVPKEIVSVLDQSKTAEDIIAEIEKEIPSDSIEEETPPVPATENVESKQKWPTIFNNTKIEDSEQVQIFLSGALISQIFGSRLRDVETNSRTVCTQPESPNAAKVPAIP